MAKRVVFLTLALVAAGCRSNPSDSLAKLTEEFVYTTLSFSPSAATAAGLHQFQKQNLDNLLDDFSTPSIEKQKKFYHDFQARLKAIPADKLDPEGRADLVMMEDQTSLALLDLETIQTAAHNPTLYVEVLGNSLFTPFVLEYAPKPQRVQSIIARLEKVPLFLDQATSNLVSSPAVWVDVAVDENQGNLDLVDKGIRAGLPDELKDAYARAARPALEAMTKLQDFLKNKLSARNSFNRQLGQHTYTLKLRCQLDIGLH